MGVDCDYCNLCGLYRHCDNLIDTSHVECDNVFYELEARVCNDVYCSENVINIEENDELDKVIIHIKKPSLTFYELISRDMLFKNGKIIHDDF